MSRPLLKELVYDSPFGSSSGHRWCLSQSGRTRTCGDRDLWVRLALPGFLAHVHRGRAEELLLAVTRVSRDDPPQIRSFAEFEVAHEKVCLHSRELPVPNRSFHFPISSLFESSFPLIQRGEEAPSRMLLDPAPPNQPQHVRHTFELSARHRENRSQHERYTDVAKQELGEQEESPAQWRAPSTLVCQEINDHKRQHKWEHRRLRPATPVAGEAHDHLVRKIPPSDRNPYQVTDWGNVRIDTV